MYRNCNYYEKELDILEPHIIIVLGNDAHSYLQSKLKYRFIKFANQNTLKLSGENKCLYFKLPHPLGQGKNTWRGNDIRHILLGRCIYREFGPMEQKAFKAWPSGELLFNYILYLVCEIKKLMTKIKL